MMANGKLSDLSMDFAVCVLKLCDSIKGHYSLVNQLERSATSFCLPRQKGLFLCNLLKKQS